MPTHSHWTVHKFGGTSVGNATCMRQCIQIIKQQAPSNPIAVVVSAMGGEPKVTDLLLSTVHDAASSNITTYMETLSKIRQKHVECVVDLLALSKDAQSMIIRQIDCDIRDITDLLRAVTIIKAAHEQFLELVSGYGEIWSATIMTAALKQDGFEFDFINARNNILIVSEDKSGLIIHWNESRSNLTKEMSNFSSPSRNLMITGYIATTPNGVATTLKRDGSDFSASIFGKLLNANCITIWTDVCGVYSADPRRVPGAQVISEISYTEAIELAYFGAKIIHPKTMAPAIAAQIPIYIRNTFAPDVVGTRIFLPPVKGELMRERCVCGFTTVDHITLFNIEGTGMIGVQGIAHRLFGALQSASISVMFIAQASSEHSICFATRDSSTTAAHLAIEEAFFYELKQGLISDIRIIRECSIIAAVGESMSNLPAVCGIFFGALGDASVTILSISQGCDERNLSAVVYTKDATRALRAVHSAFWLSSLDLNIGLVGTGRVGSAVMQTLLEQLGVLERRFGLNIKIRAMANSRKMILGEDLADHLKEKLHTFKSSSENKLARSSSFGNMRRSHSNLSMKDMEALMNEDDDSKLPTDMDQFFNHVKSGATPHSIIIDATTSDIIAALHPHWLCGKSHVITANKRAIAASLELYNAVYSAVRSHSKMYMSEVTIGAALPIRTTLNDLLCSGDAVHSIVGIMSVSSGMILTDMCESDMSFSEALARTHAKGLFEDDEFRDLEGTEAAQKLLILARDLGIAMCLEDIEIEPLATRRDISSWSCNLAEIFAKEDIELGLRVRAAKEKNCTLRYVQRIHCDPPAELGNQSQVRVVASVKLEEVPLNSPQAHVKGAIYHFSFSTARYSQHPLVVQGPLSDSANTASGIVGDLLRISKSIGAKDRGPETLTKSTL